MVHFSQSFEFSLLKKGQRCSQTKTVSGDMNELQENIRWELANYPVIHHIFIDFVAIEHQAIVIAPSVQTLHLFLPLQFHN